MKFSLVLTEYSLHGHPEEALDVAPLVDDGDAVDQRHGVHQVREVDEGAPDQPEPKWDYFNSSYLHTKREKQILTMGGGHRTDLLPCELPSPGQGRSAKFLPRSDTSRASIRGVV